MSIILNQPESGNVPALQRGAFAYDKFMGSWIVVWSTLPLWKDKKDVVITYTPIPGETTKFDDLVEYRKQSASSDSQPSTGKVRGVDTLDESAPNGVTFNWRGKGWLMIASSRWQVIGYDTDSTEPQWAVTYFSKTLFTPAGIDIYLRQSLSNPDAQTEGLFEDVKEAVMAMEGEVGELARKDGFVIGK